MDTLTESKIYAGRVSREELEYVIAFQQLLQSDIDPVNATQAEVESIVAKIFSKLHRLDYLADSVHHSWKDTGFTTGTAQNNSDHVASRLDKLYLREARALSNRPSAPLADADREEYFAKECVRLREYKEAFAKDKTCAYALLKDLAKWKSVSELWDNMTEKDKVSKVETFVTEVQQVYDAYVRVILAHLPGRTFLNRW
jgi:hypothetical protein